MFVAFYWVVLFIFLYMNRPLRKYAYENILKILTPKYKKFQVKNSHTFHISAPNTDCGTC